MKKKMASKFGLKHYFKPTPKRIRVFGDSLAAASTLAASIAVLGGHPMVGTVMMITGWAGKFISNFFTDEVKEPSKETDQDNS
jgi:hypothetical protein